MRLLYLFVFLNVAIAVRAQSSWYSDLLEARRMQDSAFKTGDESPLPADVKKTFKGLRYFEPDNRFNVMAELIRLKKPETIKMGTSDGKEKEYVKFAQVRFKLLNLAYTLDVFYSTEIRQRKGYARHMFLPFKDLTNLVETYGGGRYLDLEEPEDDLVRIDFNRAYNPYCAYSDGYSCPKVPKENYLDLRVTAGEKTLYTE